MANRHARPVKAVKIGGKIVRKQISPQEVKKTIMQANKWTDEQYRKNVDIFKNRLRSYEAYERGYGLAVEPQSPVTLLYKQAKAKQRAAREGREYKPSAKMARIQSFSAYSITKGKKVYGGTAKTAAKVKADARLMADTRDKMANFIAAHPVESAKIASLYADNPAKYAKAMAYYAEKVHAKRDEEGRATGEEPIAYGERQGSPDTPFDFEDLADFLAESEN